MSRKKDLFTKVRPIRNSSARTVIKTLPTYENILYYFIQPSNKGAKNFSNDTNAVIYSLTSEKFVVESRNSVGNSSVAYDLLNAYVSSRQLNYTNSSGSYYVRKKTINDLIAKGVYYEIVGFSHFDPIKGWYIAKDNIKFVPGFVKVQKEKSGFLDEQLKKF